MTDAPDTVPALVEPTDLTTRWERAVYWLGEATRVDEVVSIRNEAEQLKVAGRQAKDRTLTANAVELQIRSERRLGELLIKAKEAGQLGRGRIGKRNGSDAKPFAGEGQPPQRVSLEEAGIDKKLSMKAQQLAAKAGPLFEQVIAEARAKIEAGKAIVVNPMKELNTAEKKVRRAVREAQLAAKQKALPDKLYGVIYADPEWQFEVRSERGLDRAADNHYPTSDLATIKARPVGTLAAPDCALFMWATVPMLPQALEAMRFWGFTYRSQFVWDKIGQGTGYWNRNQHEILLLGTKGSVPCPAPGTQWPSLISSRPGVHSEKPDWAYELIEDYFPSLPRIELNARRLRPGWDAWGQEAPEQDSQAEGTSASAEELAQSNAASGEVSAFAGATCNPDKGRIAPVANPALAASVSPPGSQSGAANGAGGEEGLQAASPASEAYRDLVAADTLTGRHSRATAAPIVKAAYACDPIIPTKQLAADLGHPVGTALTWANRLGLTRSERRGGPAGIGQPRSGLADSHSEAAT